MEMPLLAILLMLCVFAVCNSFVLPKGKTSFATKVERKSIRNYVTTSKKDLYNGIVVNMAQDISEPDGGFDLAAWFNPNTRGGVLVWCVLLCLIPVAFYNFFVSTGMEDTKVGAYVGAIFVLLSNVAWASTYVFRVANKDMTYAKQLKDYENAVLQKRLEELADEEINALMEEIEREEEEEKKKPV